MNKVVSEEKIENLAKLSRLKLTKQEVESMQETLAPIIDYLGSLKDSKMCENTQTPLTIDSARDDIPTESLSKSEVIKNAKRHNSNAFIVPKVV